MFRSSLCFLIGFVLILHFLGLFTSVSHGKPASVTHHYVFIAAMVQGTDKSLMILDSGVKSFKY